MKKKLSSGQLKAASEITGSIAVAWFSAGAISPLFTQPQGILDFLTSFVVSLSMSGVFSIISLSLARGVRL